MPSVLNLSEAASIAIHAMISVAGGRGRPLKNSEIAKAYGVSANHSAKVLQRLQKSGFLSSVRGPGGGYRLAVDPSSVTLLDVYRAIDGRLSDSGCLFGRGRHCSLPVCLFAGLLHEANSLFERHLGSAALSDFIQPESARRDGGE
jgi:Rrf2 family transcriptional regulator, nitric oxide-sensitive transcriptional repressor